jgi:imidazole glycerol-phosphate synthase subunit HisF
MLKNRVIPSLLIKNEGLVKTIKFKKPIYVGDPLNAIKIFNEKEVDELMITDINASKENRNPNYELIEQIASECFMPLTYSGGIKNLDHAKTIFSLGVEKICIQTAAYENVNLISDLAYKYGNQSIMVSIDVKKNWLGKYELYNSSTGKLIGANWKELLVNLVNAGAGEVIVNSVDKDGTLQGPDLELINKASENLDVPLIAIGGISNLADIRNAIKAGASAVAAGSFFVFHGPHRAVIITYPHYNELLNILK